MNGWKSFGLYTIALLLILPVLGSAWAGEVTATSKMTVTSVTSFPAACGGEAQGTQGNRLFLPLVANESPISAGGVILGASLGPLTPSPCHPLTLSPVPPRRGRWIPARLRRS
jgi:hypothetical protein